MTVKILDAIPLIIIHIMGVFIVVVSLCNILNTPQNTLSFWINSVLCAFGMFLSFSAGYVCGWNQRVL